MKLEQHERIAKLRRDARALRAECDELKSQINSIGVACAELAADRGMLRALISEYLTLIDDRELNMQSNRFYERLFDLEERMRQARRA